MIVLVRFLYFFRVHHQGCIVVVYHFHQGFVFGFLYWLNETQNDWKTTPLGGMNDFSYIFCMHCHGGNSIPADVKQVMYCAHMHSKHILFHVANTITDIHDSWCSFQNDHYLILANKHKLHQLPKQNNWNVMHRSTQLRTLIVYNPDAAPENIWQFYNHGREVKS